MISPFVLYVSLITLFDLAGTFCAKFYSMNKNPWWLFATFLLFGGAGIVFALSLKYEGLAITNVLWISMSIIVVTLISYFFLKEEIATIQLAGIGVIVIGLVLVNLK